MINAWVLILFNLVFTSVPPLIYGILDQDRPADTLMKLPELYKAERTSKVILMRLKEHNETYNPKPADLQQDQYPHRVPEHDLGPAPST